MIGGILREEDISFIIVVFVCKSKTYFDINQVHNGSFNKHYKLDGRYCSERRGLQYDKMVS